MSVVETKAGVVWLDELQALDHANLATKNMIKELGKLNFKLIDLFDEYESIGRLKRGPETFGLYSSDLLGGDEVIPSAVYDGETGESRGFMDWTIVKPELLRFIKADSHEGLFVIDNVHDKLDVRAFGVTPRVAVEFAGDGVMQPVSPATMRVVRQFIGRMAYLN